MISELSPLKRRIIYSCITVFFLMVILFTFKTPSIREIKKIIRPYRADYTFEKVKITQYEQGEKIWELSSDYAEIDKNKKTSMLTKVKGRLFTDKTPKADLVAPKAVINLETAGLQLDKAVANINVSEDKQVYMRSNKLFWDPLLQEMEGLGDVSFTAEDLTVKAQHFKLKIPVKTILLNKKGKATIYLNEKE